VKVIPFRHSDTNPMIVKGVMKMSNSTSKWHLELLKKLFLYIIHHKY
jgi:hypothetical protein